MCETIRTESDTIGSYPNIPSGIDLLLIRTVKLDWNIATNIQTSNLLSNMIGKKPINFVIISFWDLCDFFFSLFVAFGLKSKQILSSTFALRSTKQDYTCCEYVFVQKKKNNRVAQQVVKKEITSSLCVPSKIPKKFSPKLCNQHHLSLVVLFSEKPRVRQMLVDSLKLCNIMTHKWKCIVLFLKCNIGFHWSIFIVFSYFSWLRKNIS